MLRLVYRSTAIHPFTNDQLLNLLRVSRRNNTQTNVTGLLLHSNSEFFQVLEGEEKAVEATFKRIAQDLRHGNIQTIFKETTQQRLFANWSMGFLPTKDIPEDAKDHFNFVIMRPTSTNELMPEPTTVRLLLKAFQTSIIQ